MVLKIRISSPNIFVNLYLDSEKNIIDYNGKELYKNIDCEINNLLNIISNWQDFSSPFIDFDSETFEVEIINKNSSKKFSGAGDYPKNYCEFKNIVKEIIKCF